MNIRSSILLGPALNWSVANVLNHESANAQTVADFVAHRYFPSNEWALGGPIVADHWSTLSLQRLSWREVEYQNHGLLIAFMRCLVRAHRGDEVDIPHDLALNHLGMVRSLKGARAPGRTNWRSGLQPAA